MSFDKEKDEMLIELVKCNSVLYDASDKNYKSTVYKHKIWENIAEAINVPVADCKKRWKHLRDHYLKKKKAEEGTGKARNTNTWEYMTQLSFISQAPHQRETITNEVEEYSQVLNEALSHNVIVLENNTEPDTEQESIPAPALGDPIHHHALDDIQASISHTQAHTPQGSTHHVPAQTPRKRKGTKSVLAEILEKRQRERNELMEKILLSQKPPESNPIKKFFDSMGDIVSTFPPHIAAETRLKVCKIVTEMELKFHNEQQATVYPQINTPIPSSEDSWNSLI